jgi:spermidine synthase
MQLLLSFLLLTSAGWFRETLFENWAQSFKVDEVVYEGKTAFQDVLIFDNKTFGRVLVLDGIVQTTEKDDSYYSEMMVHIPLLTHPDPRKILIIGGGDGNTVREALKHPHVESITLVEIDGEIIDLSKKYMPWDANGAFEDSRVTVLVDDGAAFVANTDEKFDVILVDSSDPVGPGIVLYEKPFFAHCARCLNRGGLFVNHNSVPFMDTKSLELTKANIPQAFPYLTFFQATIPTYAGGPMVFTLASKERFWESLDHLESRAALLHKSL